VLGIAFVLFLVGTPAWASGLLFDLSPTNGTTFRGSDFGPGQGVQVSTTTTINQMAMYLNMPGGGDIKYMIWDGSNSTLLFSQTVAEGASGSEDWALSDPFSFTLNAGQTYYFGVISDNSVDVGYIFPGFAYSNNGLSALTCCNTNYSNFNSPSLAGGGAAEIGLRLYGGTSAPEPTSLMLLGCGLLSLYPRLRRRK
jgi:hypothetical protein